ncbi:MAG: MoaD/ThiS family protein [Clostridia bacterium]|jgi:molybdopterin converting factor small subunit|uniref:MoaD/ThiS family protein n=1 Tax=Desulfitibacter alkalitolerans TaxID=264641 RepID=UPI0006854D69|nr:MoaD/ThiS family protein [Desulfitibacter alkalitolerans]MBS3968609.1 MoaD/ThiS family protein [Clostridia bacterium]
MAAINLRYVGGTSKFFKDPQKVLSIAEGSTVKDLLEIIWGEKAPEPCQEDCEMPFLIIVNGSNIHYLNKYETVLKDGDTVSFLPFLAGG